MSKQNSSRMAQLAANISKNTEILDHYLQVHNIPPLSFDKGAPIDLKFPAEILQAQDAIFESSVELQALVKGPIANIRNQTMPHCNLIPLQAIIRFGIATSFPIEAKASYKQISEVCGLNEVELRRLLRHAMTNYIFHETDEGLVVHTASSRVLAEKPAFRDFIGMVCDEMWPAASRTVDAMVKWPGSQEPTHTGFAIANNIENTLFSELGKHPSRAKRFGSAMVMVNSEVGFEASHILHAFPWWDSIETFVDVGGSLGEISITLANHFPKLHCTSQDLPVVVAHARLSVPQDISDRVTFMAHDFFTRQPVVGADVYLFRCVLHNHSDKYCVEILRCLVPALKPGARIIIAESVVPLPGQVSKYKEWLIRYA
ncbi:hypothetical protein OCU04_006961 [Sclerotinia nivalis]|uniref:O-methyltransferase C-terminal domain-containing protein n=1 Tax=Sclerotinia nivalis TaxID=352851 RepID=A0A9X0DL27_9HELO|nr:hypothetical protein OCU04_006961 [Sclerotinia nivalis]